MTTNPTPQAPQERPQTVSDAIQASRKASWNWARAEVAASLGWATTEECTRLAQESERAREAIATAARAEGLAELNRAIEASSIAAEDKNADWTKLCGVCGNEEKHELHRSKLLPKPYSQSPHRFIRAEEEK